MVNEVVINNTLHSIYVPDVIDINITCVIIKSKKNPNANLPGITS